MSEFLTVTAATDLLACPRKVWSERDKSLDWLRIPESIAQALGHVVHALIEEIDKGSFDSVSDADLEYQIQARWSECVADTLTRLANQTSLGAPPPPQRWPFYTLKLSRIMARMNHRRAMRGMHGENLIPEVEAVLVSTSLGLKGRADRIEFIGNSVRIVDHKTAQRPENGVPPRHRTQLLLYCLLYESCKCVQPTTAAIEWINGERDYINVSSEQLAEIKSELADARELLTSAHSPMGTPEMYACGYCPYRTVCREYLNTDINEWTNQPQFVIGKITKVLPHDSTLSINVAVSSSSLTRLASATIHKIPSTLSINLGQKIIADKLSWPRNTNNFDISWESRLKIID